MTRLQKKCMVVSLSLHGLVAVILLCSGFRSSPPPSQDLQILTLIPANIVDRAGSGGGTATVNPLPPQKVQAQVQPQPQPQPPQPQAKPIVQTEKAESVPTPTPPRRKEIVHAEPVPDETKDLAIESKPRPSKQPPRHEIKVSYTPVNGATSRKKVIKTASNDAAIASANAEAKRLKQLENSLADLASGVRNSGSPNTIVDMQGIGGGEAFAGYRDVIFSYYYRAWMTPDGSSSRLSFADAKVTIARDGSVISAELIRPSNDAGLDRSVERALRNVTKLPPFPASAHDQQRTFVIRFSLDAKEMAG